MRFESDHLVPVPSVSASSPAEKPGVQYLEPEGVGSPDPRSPVRDTIDLVNGRLVFVRAGFPVVKVFVGRDYIHVGCHRISKRAWAEAQIIVEEQLQKKPRELFKTVGPGKWSLRRFFWRG